MNTKLRLIVMNFLQFAVWGAYLTSMGTYLFNAGLASKIGLFYACQGIVSMFMPAIIGIIADRYVQAQKMLGICHTLAAAFMLGAGYYGLQAGTTPDFGTLFTLYALSVGSRPVHPACQTLWRYHPPSAGGTCYRCGGRSL